MASPPRYKKSFSPIRNLEQRYSPSNLDIILQQQRSQIRERKAYKDSVIDRLNERQFNFQSQRLTNQNYKLRRDNEILNSKQNYSSGNYLKQIQQRDSRIESLNRQINFLQGKYERQNIELKFQNQNLKRQIITLQNSKIDQINRVRLRYQNLSSGQNDMARGTYLSDIEKLSGQLEITKQLLIQKERDFGHLSLLCKQSNQQYSLNLEDLISENNALKSKLIQFQNIAQKQIRQIGAKKQLQKSRTQGILSYCKQNNVYIQKQVTRLADQLLKKNISIQSFNRQITKLQKLIQETNKRHEDAMRRARMELQQLIQNNQNTVNKLQKQFKIDLAQKKKIQIDLLQQLARRQHQLQTLNRQLHYTKDQINEKSRQIRDLKDNIQKKQEDHIKQISKVMSDSKVKRKSIKNLSSYSSLKELEEGQGSSIIKSGGLNRMSSLGGDESSTPLPTVHEEDLAHSRGFADGQDQNIDLKQLVLHYESMIQELKKNKSSQLQIASNKIQSLKLSLNDKQQEILDILNRFSPLMQYKINKQSLDQERKRKIEQHHKGDVDLLSVMLDKYGIVALSKK